MAADTLGSVQDAIRDLKYRPNTSARQLKTGHTPLIGLLVPSMANPMYGFIAREVETLAQERYGFRIMIGNTYRDERTRGALLRGPDGARRARRDHHLVADRRAACRGRGRTRLVVVSYDRRATPGEGLA